MKCFMIFLSFLLSGCLYNNVVRQEQLTGTIMAFGGELSKIPDGWRLCNGDTVLRTGVCAKLFHVIGNTWGSGDGTTTFVLPDLRGLFLRGVDGGAARDPDAKMRTDASTKNTVGGVVGSYQEDALQNHTHLSPLPIASMAGQDEGHPGNKDNSFQIGPVKEGSALGRWSTETRPRNAYVYFIIKL